MVGDETKIIGDGERVIAHGHPFSSLGVVIDRSGRSSLKVLLDEPPPGFPAGALWFRRDEVEREPVTSHSQPYP